VLRDIGSAIARRALASTIALVASSYLAHQLGPGMLGVYVGLLALGQILTAVFMFGLDTAPVYLLRQSATLQRRIHHRVTLASIAASGVTVVLGLAIDSQPTTGLPWLAEVHSWGVSPFVYAAAMILMFSQASCLQGLLRLGAANLAHIGFAAIFLGLALATDAIQGQLEPEQALHLWAASAAVCFAIVYAAIRRDISDSAGPEADARQPARGSGQGLRYATNSYVANLLGVLNSRAPALVVAATLGGERMGSFAAAHMLHDIFSFFAFAVVSVSFPKLSGEPDSLRRVRDLAFACRINTAMTAAASILFLVLFDPLCTLLLGADFVTPHFHLMCAVVLLSTTVHSTVRILCGDFSAQGRPHINVLLNLPTTAVFLISFMAFGRFHGEWGAVASFCLSLAVFDALAIYTHRRGLPVAAPRYFLPQRADLGELRGLLRR
jgi:O-antigen/teichoic acid export membrane protein